MSNLIASFSYYAGQTADKMGIPKEDKIVRACVELMFNVMLEQGGVAATTNPLQKNTKAVADTLEWIKPRYDSLKEYAPDFFKNSAKADLEAVAVARICAGYTDLADNIGTAIPPDVIERAEKIIGEAEEIVGTVMRDRNSIRVKDRAEPSIEAVFVAHGFLNDMLSRNDEVGSFEYYGRRDFRYLIDTMLTPIHGYVDAETKWGQAITQKIEEHKRNIDQIIKKLPDSLRDKPVLTLVHSAPV